MKHVRFTGTDVGRRHRSIGNTILAVFIVIGILIIAGYFGVKVFLNIGHNSLLQKPATQAPVIVDNDGDTPSAEQQEVLPDTVWKEEWVSYDGKIYEYNDDMLTFLAMGIDKMGKVEKAKNKTDGGQADALFLVCANPDTKQINIIGVNRDTMVDVVMAGVGENGEDVITTAEIAVQHGFGDGMEQSCDFAAGDDFQWFRSLWAKPQFLADPQAVFVVCQSLTVRIQDVVIHRQSDGCKGALIQCARHIWVSGFVTASIDSQPQRYASARQAEPKLPASPARASVFP